ncbi:hypothetical protein GQ42DRAFT_126838 [Ramicandelaber brevisporus]|nr:hypothetical protein GQ42DRAFT_126838 [Ramicandelaber brevisporus]
MVDIERFEQLVRENHATLGNAVRAKEVFRAWRNYYGPVWSKTYTAVRKVWLPFEQWLQCNAPQVYASLEGALDWQHDQSLREMADSSFGSEPLRFLTMLYHLHNGQDMEEYHQYGLFGTYECYDQLASVLWLSMDSIQEIQFFDANIKIFAWCPGTGKHLAVVTGLGQYHQRIRDLVGHVVEISTYDDTYTDHGLADSFLTKYCSDVMAGILPVRAGPNVGRISMFPNKGGLSSTTITNGIAVTITLLYSVELIHEGHTFTYCIRMRYTGREAVGWDQCQLVSRHWVYVHDSKRVENYSGYGVRGEHPILSIENPYHEYCSRMQYINGTEIVQKLYGAYKFVPGTIEKPLGMPFRVQIPELPLTEPTSLKVPQMMQSTESDEQTFNVI